MARHTSKPLYIERVAYISNVSITKVGGTSAAQRAQLNCATYQPYCAVCTTLPYTLLCNVPSPTVKRSQANCTTSLSLLCNVSIPTMQCAQLYYTTCTTLLCNLPSSTVQRAQPYCQFVPITTVKHSQPNCQTFPAQLCNVHNSTMQHSQLHYATCPTLLCNVPNSTLQRAQPFCQCAFTYCATCLAPTVHSIINSNTIY